MYCLRRSAFRVLSSTPSACTSTTSRHFTSITTRIPRFSISRSKILPLQRRWLADEAAATQSEPEADGAALNENADNSIANSSTTSSEPPKTEEQAASAVADDAIPIDSSSTAGSVAETARSTTQTARNVASQAASSVAGAVAATSSSAATTTGFGRNQEQGPPSTTIYVGNLFFDVRSEDLRKEFERAGEVVDAKVITDQRGLSKGFGYIEFSNLDSAAKAISLYNLQNFEGRRLSVQYSQPRHGAPGGGRSSSNMSSYGPIRQDRPVHPPTKTLFIGNMSFDMSDRDLNSLFREIKNVIDVRVAIDRRTGQPRGFAHADFTDVESSERAMEELRGKMVCGRALRVDFSTSTGRAALGSAGAPPQERS